MKTAIPCSCGHELKADPSMVGLRLTCPRCRQTFEVTREHVDRPTMVAAPEPRPLNWGRAMRLCPVCGCHLIDILNSRSALRAKTKDQSAEKLPTEELNRAYIFFSPRECSRCRAIWLPPIPRWAGIFIALGGGLIASVCIWISLEPGPRQNGLRAATLMGLAGVAYGIAVSRGYGGGGSLLREGDESHLRG